MLSITKRLRIHDVDEENGGPKMDYHGDDPSWALEMTQEFIMETTQEWAMEMTQEWTMTMVMTQEWAVETRCV